MNSSQPTTAGVIDIGSNSIKMLAARKTGSELEILEEFTSETRISHGISQDNPCLREDRMQAALEAIKDLHQRILKYQPQQLRIGATSAVRDAKNGQVFFDKVRSATGTDMEIIAGEEEARLISRGIATDDNLHDQDDLMIMDMGGGSVEVIHLQDKHILMADSLPLGCVRVMEHCVPHPELPLSFDDIQKIRDWVNLALKNLDLKTTPGKSPLGVGTGGTFTTARSILAHHRGSDLYHTSPYIDVEEMISVFEKSASMTLEERYSIPNLPKNRADVFPTAMLTLIIMAERAGVRRFFHSFRNLRFGIMAEMLDL